MKKRKLTALFLFVAFSLTGFGCAGKELLNPPFEIDGVESVEIFHYDGAPVAAEKKIAIEENDVAAVYRALFSAQIEQGQPECAAGASVTGFRFHLRDGTDYEAVYVCHGEKMGELKAGGRKFRTSENIGAIWDLLPCGTAVSQEELPG